MAFNALINYWQENIKNNVKKISAIVGDILMNLFIIFLYAAKAGLGWSVMLMMMALIVRPYLFQSINLVFKGEKMDLQQTNLGLNKQLAHQRELSEYQIKLAAIEGDTEKAVLSNKRWNDTNEALEKSTKEKE